MPDFARRWYYRFTKPSNTVKVQSHYPKLKVIQTQNQGVVLLVIRWQRSLVVHIAFLDSDDKVFPTFYTQAVKVLNQYQNVGFVAS